MVPLDRAPSYTKPNANMELLRELVATGNELREMMLQLLAPTMPDAHIGLFNTHGLFTDIINNPKNYLNGTVDLNVESAWLDCSRDGGCTNMSDRDSFLWWVNLGCSVLVILTPAGMMTFTLRSRLVVSWGERWHPSCQAASPSG